MGEKITKVHYFKEGEEKVKSARALPLDCKYSMFWNITELLQIIILLSYIIYKMECEITYC